MGTRVVNIRKEKCTKYIGRSRNSRMHYGNPFTHLRNVPGTIWVPTRDEACDAFEKWLRGEDWHDVEQERRQWILDNMEELRGHDLGCFCAPERCHGHTYKKVLEE